MVYKGRTRFLSLMVLLVVTGLIGRLGWVQVVQADAITAKVESWRLVQQPLVPTRGAIRDRDGLPLAVSVPYYWLVASPFHMQEKEKQQASVKLSAMLKKTADEILRQLQENPESQYEILAKKLTLEQARTVEAMRLPGINLIQQTDRVYPQAFTANHILGYLNAEGHGDFGLEARYDTVLGGAPGWILAEFTHGRIPIENLIKAQVEAKQGQDLILSIDAALHHRVEQILDRVVLENKAQRAMVLAMNPHTGEILVMAMRPGAHPGDRRTWGDPVDFSRVNGWATSPLPMGSIFKTITVAAALEEQKITTTESFHDPGKVIIDGWAITNWDGPAPSTKYETVSQLMQRSSNVALIDIGNRLGKENFRRYLQGFGFLEKTGIDLSFEDTANIGVPFEEKIAVDWANMYIGQHLEVTPIQMLSAVAAITNGGSLVQPHLVKEIREAETGNVVQVTSTAPRRQVISQATAAEVREIMISVIEQGTGGGAKMAGYTAGGKTGTAEKFLNGQRQAGKYVADFVGFAPAHNPQVVMLVMVDEPTVGQGYGGLVAAPVFKEVMPLVLQAIGIPPDSKAALDQEKAPPKVVSGVVPNVAWLPAVRASDRLREAGFTAKFIGTGELVAEQSVKAGTAAKSGTVVELKLVARDPANETVRVPDFAGLSLAEASQLAGEIGLTLKPSGSGFVADQEPLAGAAVPARSSLAVRLAPRQ